MHKGTPEVAALAGQLTQSRMGLGMVGLTLEELLIGEGGVFLAPRQLRLHAAEVQLVPPLHATPLTLLPVVADGAAEVAHEAPEKSQSRSQQKRAHHETGERQIPAAIRAQAHVDAGGIQGGEVGDDGAESEGEQDA
jgi:hypothetical protein